MAARYILKRRAYEGKRPVAFGGLKDCYGPWTKISDHATADEARNAIPSAGLYDWGIFYRGKKIK